MCCFCALVSVARRPIHPIDMSIGTSIDAAGAAARKVCIRTGCRMSHIAGRLAEGQPLSLTPMRMWAYLTRQVPRAPTRAPPRLVRCVLPGGQRRLGYDAKPDDRGEHAKAI